MSRIMGIDLGTSTTSVAVVTDGTPVVIPGVRNNKVTPSYIYIMDDGRILVGENAKAEAIADPYNTVWATKRLIGRRFNDPHVKECLERLSYEIVAADNGEVLIKGRDKSFTPVKVASLILKFVARLAANHLGENVKKAVITVPASFNDLQRKATKLAAENIGLEVIRLVNEPTASALAWGYHRDADATVAVYDLGGGTFDVSILSIGHGVYEVLATRGDSWLGGEDFDNRLVSYVVNMFKSRYKIDILNDKMAHQRVKTAAERAKIALSEQDQTRIFLPAICPDMNRMADVDYTITRSHFEGMVEDLIKQTVETFKQTLADAELTKDDLDNVVLVGGMTRLPLVRQRIEEFLGRSADYSVDPDLAVAMGAAIHAAALEGEQISVAAPRSSRIKPEEPAGDDFITAMLGERPADVGVSGQDLPVPKGAPAPRRRPAPKAAANEPELEDVAVSFTPAAPRELPPPSGPDPEDPAPAPAPPPGAAGDPARATARQARAPLLIDVVSQSVGIADMAGLFVPLIPRNSKLPAKMSQVFTTAINNQEAIRISVYQGEERSVKDKVSLGEFSLRGIEKAARGVPQILVTFSIDQSGLFTVSAKDLKTGAEKEIRLEGLAAR
jgi:molecular chaperone DnaK (HSP70)